NAANPTISDCSFDNNANYPIYTYANRVKDITGTNSFSGNAFDAIYVRNQTITTGTWLDQGVPYVINGNCTVADLETLTINPGVEIKFNANNYFRVYGSLIANGTDSEHIVFTSNQAVPSKGDWNRIFFSAAENSSMMYCDMDYAGSGTSTIDVRSSGTNVTIDNCTIDNSGGYGIYNRNGSLTAISNMTIQNCDNYPIYVLADGVTNITGTLSLTGNTPQAIWVQAGTINNGSWIQQPVPYVLGGGNFTVADGQTLTINQGVTMKIDGTRTFTVLGTLIADGDAGNLITFTSNAGTPAKGDWRYIYFNNADPGCMLDYCDISYGGSATATVYINNTGNTVSISNSSISNSATLGIYHRTNSEATISDCSITNCDDFAIRTAGDFVKDITGTMTITGNTPNAIRVDAQAISTGTWMDHGAPYVMWADMNQTDLNTLTLEPGVELQFNTNARLRVYGTLVADGEELNPIVFTSSQAVPAAGDWERILFDGADAGTVLDYCQVMYGGATNGNLDIYQSGNNVSISNTLISNSNTRGVYIRNGSNPSFINCEIINNTDIGVYINGASQATFGTSVTEWNDIYGNGNYELRNGSLDIDAMYVYWGTSGCGDISGLIYDDEDQANLGVVNYNPYLDSGHGMPLLATTWTGAVNTSWHESGNWDNSAPCGNTDVTIPASPANQPVVLGPESCNNLTLEAGARLTIGTGNSLAVAGDLLLEADATGTASLVENGGLSVTGTTTSEFYISEDRWHYVSSPMTDQTANSVFGLWFRYHDELTNTFIPIVDETTPLNVGQGYIVWSKTGNTTAQFTGGTLNSGPFVYSLTNTGSGWNFVGNPYPSAIDWDDLSWIKSYITGTVYVHDGSNYLEWNGSTGDLTDGIIPAMQGFFVRANGPSPALAVGNGARTHGVDPYKANSVDDLLVLSITGNGYKDKTFVNFKSQATLNFDDEFDGYKLMGIEEAPQLYTIIGDDKFSINTLSEITPELTIPMALEVGAETEYTILASELNSFDSDVTIYLEDIKENVVINMNLQSDYTFMAAPGDETHRFNIYFEKSTPAADETIAESSVKIYSNSNSVYVRNRNADLNNATIDVYNISGQKVYTDKLQDVPVNRFSLNLESGYYVVKVISTGEVTSQKVFIK
ncbi:right-handed parallel beta-helix repeat-containing protein, partial [Desulfosarcina sp.]|nr:right-handed parallel beta-helix repeat-containing protein [Desulfosarcina sp.]